MKSQKKIAEKFQNRMFAVCFAACATVFCLLLGLILWMVSMEKEITLIVNGYERQVETYDSGVSGLLKSEGIPKERVKDAKPGMWAGLTEGCTIELTVENSYTVIADGETHKVKAAAGSVSEAVEAAGVELGEYDETEPALTEFPEDGVVIRVHRVTVEKDVRSTELAYSIEMKKDNTLPEGEREIKVMGQPGTLLSTYRVTTKDGEVIDEELLGEEKTLPVTEEVAVGTMPVTDSASAAGSSSKKSASGYNSELDFGSGDTYTIVPGGEAPNGMACSKVLTMKATAYYEPPGSLTKSGTPSRVGAVAVDPDVIPLGTKLYVEDYGYCTAEDTGRLIKGRRIDIFLSSEAACNEWGVRNVIVYVLK